MQCSSQQTFQNACHSSKYGLKNCINEIREWMGMNLLKLNGGKTEFIILGTQQQLQKISHISIQIGEDLVTPVDMV